MDNIEKSKQLTESKPLSFWGGILIALAVFGGQVVAAILGGILGGVLVSVGLIEVAQLEGVVIAVTLTLGFIIAVGIILRRRKLAETAWFFDKSDIALIPIAILMLYSISYAVGVVLENVPGYDDMLEDYTSMFEHINPILLLIGGGVIGPVCEEIIFRGIILKEFLKSRSPKRAIVYSAIIFGVIHFIPLQVFSAFFAGLILGYVYYKTQSLWIPIIMHVLNNVIAFAIGVDEEASMSRDLFDSEMMYWMSFLLSGVICFVLYKLFETLRPSPSMEPKSA